MKWLFAFIPISLGVLTIIQAGLNREVGLRYGWPVAGSINNFFGLMAALLALALWQIYFANKESALSTIQFQWWFPIPGIIGICFVIGIPYAMSKIDASHVFILLISSQIIAALAWDLWVAKVPIASSRYLAVLLVLAGAYLSTRPS